MKPVKQLRKGHARPVLILLLLCVGLLGVAYQSLAQSVAQSLAQSVAQDTPQEIRTFKGHTSGVYSVAFSPDGRYVLSDFSTHLKLWEASTGQEVRMFRGHTSGVYSVVFGPDGHYILSGSGDRTLKLWDMETGGEIRTFEGHTADVTSVAFSPYGYYALSGSGDGTVKLWDVDTGQEIRSLGGYSSALSWVYSVAFSPDGRYVLLGSSDEALKLWEVSTGREIRSFKGHTSYVLSVAFSPDGRYVLSGSDDRTVKLWSTSTGQEVRSFCGHSAGVYSVAFSPNGRYVLSGSGDRTMKLWEVSTGRLARSFAHKGDRPYIYSVAFSPNGRYVLSGARDGTLKLWQSGIGGEVAGNDPPWITTTALKDATEDIAYVDTVWAEDVDESDILCFSLLAGPKWLSIDAGNGILSGTPRNEDVGVDSVQLEVSDGAARDTLGTTIYVVNVNDPPTSFALLSPPSGALLGNARPTFRWTQSTDRDVGDLLRYVIYISTDSLFGTSRTSTDSTYYTTYVPSTDLSDDTYYWKVLVRDLAGE